MSARPETIEEAKERWRPEMLPEAVPYYDHDWSVHPDAVRMSFSDGSTAIYDIRVEQPHPIILENVKIIRRMNGYVNQPARRRGKK